MVLKNVRNKAEEYWTTTKKTLALLSVWGLIFSVVTVTKMGAVFEYDDTLVFSTPAFAKAFAGVQQPYSPQFWAIVNKSYDLEQVKFSGFGLAWVLRLCGFRVGILVDRPSFDGEALRKEWRRLTPKSLFCFAGDRNARKAFFSGGNNVLFFGDNDSNIFEARQAGLYPIRIKRHKKSSHREDYHPGTLNELVIPLSQY